MPSDDHRAVGDASAEDAASALRRDARRSTAARRLLPSVGSAGAGPHLDVLAGWAAQLVGARSGRISLLVDVQERVGASGPQPEDVPGHDDAAPGERERLAEWLCTQTAASREPLVVADTGTDERVAALWPVTTGGVGSYLGAPLLDADGLAVGAVCVFDPAARTWSERDVQLLQQVAQAAMGELELSALGGEHEHDRALLELTVAAAELGTFDLDLTTGELVMNDRLLELSGLTPDTFGGRPEEVYGHVHPEDRDAVIASVRAATEGGGVYAAEYRILDDDGTVRWVAARGATLPAPDGRPARLLGAAYDVTGLRAAATRTEQILDTMAVGYLAVDAGWVITYVNDQGSRIAAATREELVGRSFWEAFPGTVGTVFEERYRDAVATGRVVTFDAFYPEPLDVWVEVRGVPENGGLALYFLDITARVQAQRAAEEAAARRDLSEAVSRELTGALDAEQAVGRLARLVVPALGDWCLISLVDDAANATTAGPGAGGRAGVVVDVPVWGGSADPLNPGTLRRRGLRDVGSWHHEERFRDLVEEYARHRLRELGEDAPVWKALRENRSVVIEDATETLTAALPPDGPARALLARLAPGSGVVLPLRGRGRTVGLLSLFLGRERSPLTEADLVAAVDVADRAGLALDAARAYRQQRDLAAGLQQSLLTEPPQPDHGQVVVRYAPAAEAAQVGGDWYDAFMQPDGATVLVIGDVVGHDTRAAAAMSQVRTVLRTLGATGTPTPAELLTRTDEAMAALQISTTATVLVARLEQTPDERARGVTRLRWSSAGHPPAMVVHPDGVVEPLLALEADLLLGVVTGTDRSDHEVVLDRGSTVVFFTDGLVERRDQSLQDGLELLQRVLAELAGADTDLDTLVDDLLRRLLPLQAEDDAAVVAVRLHRQDRPRPAEAGPVRIPGHVPPAPA